MSTPHPLHLRGHNPYRSGSKSRRRTLIGFVGTRRVVEIILTVVLGVGGCLLLFGANFGLNMVHDQLNAQAISFPAKGTPALSPKEFPGLQQYAGQKVDTGPKAKAYANEFINVHLQSVAGRQDLLAGERGFAGRPDEREADRPGRHPVQG